MGKELKKVLCILMPNDFQDTEFLEPYNMIIADGHHVDIAGFQESPAKGTYGLVQKTNLLLSEMAIQDFDEYDALVIPGGKGSMQYLWYNEELQDIVRYFHNNNKIVATICAACIVPAQAEILTNKTATVYPTEETKELFAEHNVIFSHDECVVLPDEKIITCQGPKFAETFGLEILNLLNKN